MRSLVIQRSTECRDGGERLGADLSEGLCRGMAHVRVRVGEGARDGRLRWRRRLTKPA
jgi:hypothetical protein